MKTLIKETLTTGTVYFLLVLLAGSVVGTLTWILYKWVQVAPGITLSILGLYGGCLFLAALKCSLDNYDRVQKKKTYWNK